MTAMHMMTVEVALGGDIRNVVHRQQHNPVSFPEIQILRAIHGDNGVSNPQHCATVETDPAQEKKRLVDIYGGIVDQIYPGFAPMMQMVIPGYEDEVQADATPESKPTPAKKKKAVKKPATAKSEPAMQQEIFDQE